MDMAYVSCEASRAEADFGPNVFVFDPSTPGMQERLNEIFAAQERNEFGSARYAYLFKPGAYQLDVRMGYYMQALGLARRPDDVVITGAVRSTSFRGNGDVTCNFWRSAENLAVIPGDARRTNVWAMSQGGGIRRLHVKGGLDVWEGGWASGGFSADCVVDGKVESGGQQQWFARNCRWQEWGGGQWNMVFVGAVDPPAGSWPEKPVTVVEKTPVIREKPYLCVEDDGSYCVRVPKKKTDAQGEDWDAEATAIPIDRFHIARSDRDNATSINDALARGLNVLLTPGVYELDDALRVTHPGTVILGLGFATLVPQTGLPALIVADVDGVTLSGIMVDAGPRASSTLVQIGTPGQAVSHADNPTCLHDLFCRVGGSAAGAADVMVSIDSRDVVGDNLWLWRADHGRGVGWDLNRNKTGLVVNGDDVTIYGLFVEHTQEYQTIWNGNGGRVFFYQSEMPYDPPRQADWTHDEANGFASYKVADHVTAHEARGVGVYCTFRKPAVMADNAIEAPTGARIAMRHLVTIRLGGNQPGSGIRHVINGQGDAMQTRATTD